MTALAAFGLGCLIGALALFALLLRLGFAGYRDALETDQGDYARPIYPRYGDEL